MVRRKKLTIFTDCKDNTSVLELKRIIEGIICCLLYQLIFIFHDILFN